MYIFLLLICSSSLCALQKTKSVTLQQQEQKEIESLDAQLAAQLKNYVETTSKIKQLLLAGAQPNNSFIQCASEDHTLLALLQEAKKIHEKRSLQLSTATLQVNHYNKQKNNASISAQSATPTKPQQTTGSVARPLKSILKAPKVEKNINISCQQEDEWWSDDDDWSRQQRETDDWINGYRW